MVQIVYGIMMKITKNMDEKQKLTFSKGAMVALLTVGIAIANIPGLTITHMFLFYCTFRATTMLPTMLTLIGAKLKAAGVTAGVVTALVVGLPIFAYGNVYGLSTYKTIGSLLTTKGTSDTIVSIFSCHNETYSYFHLIFIQRLVLCSMGTDYLINQTVFHRFLRRHKIIPLGIPLDHRKGLAGLL